MAKVSVIMPCFNHGRFLRESVVAVLGQTHSKLELIIVDDCSRDDSWEVISEWASTDSRITAIRHEKNLGVSRSRNEAFRTAAGDYVAFCDADDIWDRNKLELQLKLLKANPGHDLVYGDSLIIDETGKPTGQKFSQLFPPPKPPSGDLFRELTNSNFINTQSVLLRRTCLEHVGGFDEDLKVVEDWWFWIQLSRGHRFLYCRTPLGNYRIHGASTNKHQRVYAVSRFKVCRRMLNKYESLPVSTKANLLINMGVDLCSLKKALPGRRLFWNALCLSLRDITAFRSFCRAARRILLPGY